jgi:antitoxin (DNA-binding transcriptional repressor) of toxin-antitoxin stability system
VVDGLTLAAVLDRIAGGGRVVLTHGGDDVAVVVRPDDLSDAATAYLLEALERVDLSGLLADLEAAPHPVTPNGRPQSPPAGVS